jgi:hypothetical protein
MCDRVGCGSDFGTVVSRIFTSQYQTHRLRSQSNLLFNCYGDFLSRVKLQRPEADQSLSTSSEAKRKIISASAPHIGLHDIALNQLSGQAILTLMLTSTCGDNTTIATIF